MRNAGVLTLVILLVTTGLSLFFYKAFELHFPLKPDVKSQSWRIEARVNYAAQGKPVKIDVMVPRSTDQFSIVDESFVSDGYGLTTHSDAANGNRQTQWTKRRVNGRDTLFYRAVVYSVLSKTKDNSPPPAPYSPLHGTQTFAEMAESDPYFLALLSIIDEFKEQSADEISFAENLVGWAIQHPNESRLAAIRKHNDANLSVYGAAVEVLNYARIPARLMNGVMLMEDGRDVKPVSHVEVFVRNKWRPIRFSLNANAVFLPWWVGDTPLINIEGGSNAKMSISVKRHLEHALTEAIWRGDKVSESFYAFSIYRLPVDIQLLLSVLLTIPAGAIIISFFRQMIGIKTFGTFMPILVAICFRETQLAWGIGLFTIIVGFGMLFRSMIARLYLLMVPRLSCVLTGVVIAIYLLSILASEMQITAGLSISLFPIVILTMLIERMSIMWDESGARETMKHLFGSLIVAVIGFYVMTHPLLVHLMVTFPELLLVVMAILIVMGRYNGFKLTEYMRFYSLKQKAG